MWLTAGLINEIRMVVEHEILLGVIRKAMLMP